VIEGATIRKRNKKPSKELRAAYGHTPLSSMEDIPWNCRKLIVGTGMHAALPVTEELKRDAKHHKVNWSFFPRLSHRGTKEGRPPQNQRDTAYHLLIPFPGKGTESTRRFTVAASGGPAARVARFG